MTSCITYPVLLGCADHQSVLYDPKVQQGHTLEGKAENRFGYKGFLEEIHD